MRKTNILQLRTFSSIITQAAARIHPPRLMLLQQCPA